MNIAEKIAEELHVRPGQVQAAADLIDAGNTIPFIARYRKEATGFLDDGQLRLLEEKLLRLRALEERREQVLKSISEQGKLTNDLQKKIAGAGTLSELEDLYLPYKQKRRTRASAAREKGLERLARYMLCPEKMTFEEKAAEFVTPAGADIPEEKQVPDTAAALRGAQDILAEMLSENATLRAGIRQNARQKGILRTTLRKKDGPKELQDQKSSKPGSPQQKDRSNVYDMYDGREEPVRSVPGHRILALNRGEKEGFLQVKLDLPEEEHVRFAEQTLREMSREAGDLAVPALVPAAVSAEQTAVFRAVSEDAYTRLVEPAIEREIRNELTERAEEGAIRVFQENLKQLLMQPPVSGHTVLGWDPGYRTGCKIAVVDPTGKVLETTVVYPTPPALKTAETRKTIFSLIDRYGVTLISLGNGTASRESEQLIAEMIRERSGLSYVIVNEAGASVYSASALAAKEFPDLDVGGRSAASMARRLQDPLAELVKIDPKAIGVGQYQHDMDQTKLGNALHGVVEDCVNRVGADLNTASVSLLSYAAGISAAVAGNIVAYREANGSFRNRRELLKVPKLGPKTFEQCAGFLRIADGEQPLDSTAVHPENYEAVKKLFRDLGMPLEKQAFRDAVKKARQAAGQSGAAAAAGASGTAKVSGTEGTSGNAGNLQALAARIGVSAFTLEDILKELEQPGRDPRSDMPAPVLRSDVLGMEDLAPGMKLKGTVRNIVDFGAFVDIGVHQDGLVHISRMAKRFIRHPLEAVSVGDVVEVTVLSVDPVKKRIALSMVD